MVNEWVWAESFGRWMGGSAEPQIEHMYLPKYQVPPPWVAHTIQMGVISPYLIIVIIHVIGTKVTPTARTIPCLHKFTKHVIFDSFSLASTIMDFAQIKYNFEHSLF